MSRCPGRTASRPCHNAGCSQVRPGRARSGQVSCLYHVTHWHRVTHWYCVTHWYTRVPWCPHVTCVRGCIHASMSLRAVVGHTGHTGRCPPATPPHTTKSPKCALLIRHLQSTYTVHMQYTYADSTCSTHCTPAPPACTICIPSASYVVHLQYTHHMQVYAVHVVRTYSTRAAVPGPGTAAPGRPQRSSCPVLQPRGNTETARPTKPVGCGHRRSTGMDFGAPRSLGGEKGGGGKALGGVWRGR